MKNILTIGLATKGNSAGLEVHLGMPVWVAEDAPEVAEIEADVRALVKKIGDLVFGNELFKKVTSNDEQENIDKLESSLELTKAFGAMAEIIKEIAKDHMDESELKQVDEMIKMSKLASMIEDMKKDLFK